MADSVDADVWDDVVHATLNAWLGRYFEPCGCRNPNGKCAKHAEFIWRKRFKEDLVTLFVRSEPWLAKADRLRLRDMMVTGLEERGYPHLLANTSSSKARVIFPDGTCHRVTGIAMAIKRRGGAALPASELLPLPSGQPAAKKTPSDGSASASGERSDPTQLAGSPGWGGEDGEDEDDDEVDPTDVFAEAGALEDALGLASHGPPRKKQALPNKMRRPGGGVGLSGLGGGGSRRMRLPDADPVLYGSLGDSPSRLRSNDSNASGPLYAADLLSAFDDDDDEDGRGLSPLITNSGRKVLGGNGSNRRNNNNVRANDDDERWRGLSSLVGGGVGGLFGDEDDDEEDGEDDEMPDGPVIAYKVPERMRVKQKAQQQQQKRITGGGGSLQPLQKKVRPPEGAAGGGDGGIPASAKRAATEAALEAARAATAAAAALASRAACMQKPLGGLPMPPAKPSGAAAATAAAAAALAAAAAAGAPAAGWKEIDRTAMITQHYAAPPPQQPPPVQLSASASSTSSTTASTASTLITSPPQQQSSLLSASKPPPTPEKTTTTSTTAAAQPSPLSQPPPQRDSPLKLRVEEVVEEEEALQPMSRIQSEVSNNGAVNKEEDGNSSQSDSLTASLLGRLPSLTDAGLSSLAPPARLPFLIADGVEEDAAIPSPALLLRSESASDNNHSSSTINTTTNSSSTTAASQWAAALDVPITNDTSASSLPATRDGALTYLSAASTTAEQHTSDDDNAAAASAANGSSSNAPAGGEDGDGGLELDMEIEVSDLQAVASGSSGGGQEGDGGLATTTASGNPAVGDDLLSELDALLQASSRPSSNRGKMPVCAVMVPPKRKATDLPKRHVKMRRSAREIEVDGQTPDTDAPNRGGGGAWRGQRLRSPRSRRHRL